MEEENPYALTFDAGLKLFTQIMYIVESINSHLHNPYINHHQNKNRTE